MIAHEPMGGGGLVSGLLDRRGCKVHEHVVTADMERPNDAADFPDASGYDIIVAMGSVRSLTDTGEISSWIFDEIELVRSAQRRGTPMLGICFGGQLLAAALGGTVEQAPAPEIGWYEISDAGDVPNPIGRGPWFQWHHDRFIPPAEAEVLAANGSGAQLFRLGRSVGTQFHPEVTYAHVKGFLSEAAEDYLQMHDVDPAQMLEDMRRHEDRNTRQCTALIDWFLDEAALSSTVAASASGQAPARRW